VTFDCCFYSANVYSANGQKMVQKRHSENEFIIPLPGSMILPANMLVLWICFSSCCKQRSEALPYFFRYRCKFIMPSFIVVLFCIFRFDFQCCFRGVPVVEVRLRGLLSASSAMPNQVYMCRAPPVASCFVCPFMFFLL
jgi:hypothetical protein